MQGVAVRSLGQSWIALPRSQVEVIVRIGGLNVILFDPLCLLKTLGSHSICLSVMLAWLALSLQLPCCYRKVCC